MYHLVRYDMLETEQVKEEAFSHVLLVSNKVHTYMVPDFRWMFFMSPGGYTYIHRIGMDGDNSTQRLLYTRREGRQITGLALGKQYSYKISTHFIYYF